MILIKNFNLNGCFSCGRLIRPFFIFMKENLIGLKFNKLTVIGSSGKDKYRRISWFCKCECGNGIKAYGYSLKSGNTKSCGCLRAKMAKERGTTHGKSASSLAYSCWERMKSRCNNPNVWDYKHYGGRGITVCERWKSFSNFLEDMGERPSLKHSIDRYPNHNGNYEPSNCRWATQLQQGTGKRNNHWIECKGEKKTLAQWGRYLNMWHSTIRFHLKTKTMEEIVIKYKK